MRVMKWKNIKLLFLSITAFFVFYILIQIFKFSPPYPGAQVTASGLTEVTFTGESYRTYNLTRLFKSFRLKVIGGAYNQTKKHECSKWIVFTTDCSSKESVKRIKQVVDSQASWCCVVVFDKKTSADQCKKIENKKFILLTVEDQNLLASRERGYKIVEKIPWNNFGRKNIGYLYAIHQKAEAIFDVDDDNLLLHNDIATDISEICYWYVASRNHVYNPYKDFLKTNVTIWPRGFPIDYIKSANSIKIGLFGKPMNSAVSIKQFLANHEPDVDANYRFTGNLPIYFDQTKRIPIALQTGTLAPYNAQATLHLRSAFFGLVLPTTVSGRVSDIWRSYFTQRLLWDIGGNVAFIKPNVKQIRNVHNNMAEFQSELSLYRKTSALVKFLINWQSKSKTLEERMEELAIEFYERGYWEFEDVLLIQLWIQDLHETGYQFPKTVDSKQNFNMALKDERHKNEAAQTKRTLEAKNKKHKLQLFLRMTFKPFLQVLYNKILVPSLKLFWQHEVEPLNVVIVLDDESKQDHLMGTKIGHDYPYPKVFYEDRQAFDNGDGKTRMQWGMHWADNYTHANYVGFIDTDTMPVTLMTQDLLFDGDKPHIWGLFNKPTGYGWKLMPQSTHYILKKQEVLRAMFYFPVIIKVDHLVKLREYVESVHNKSFSIVYRDMAKQFKFFSQFNIMANFVWYFHQNEYVWHLEEFDGPGFNGSIKGQTKDFSRITPAMRVPYPQSTIHFKYLTGDGKKKKTKVKVDKGWNPQQINDVAISTRNRLLREGYCFSAGFRHTPQICKEFSEKNIQETLFEFEGHSWTWDKRCYNEQKKHYDRIRRENRIWNNEILHEIFCHLN